MKTEQMTKNSNRTYTAFHVQISWTEDDVYVYVYQFENKYVEAFIACQHAPRAECGIILPLLSTPG